MQIAKVIPKIKTRGEGIFDYAISPEFLPLIKVGVLVLVPFRGRKIEGIIIDIKRSSQVQNLKTIISIIDPDPVVDLVHIKLAQWMANYYLGDLSKTLFDSIVPPAKRTINKIETTGLIPQTNTLGLSRKFLIVADFSLRLDFYLKSINKTLAQNKQVIILVPDLTLTQSFTQKIKTEVVLLHANLTKTQRWLSWNKIRQGQAKVIIGSNSAIFAPVNNLGLIIVDQEENEAYKSDQAPHQHSLKVAQELASLTSADLIIGSDTPSVETYFQSRKNNYLYKIKNERKANISVIDMNFERSILSQPLQDKITQTLENKQKTILILNRKGEGSKVSCEACHWIYTCPDCQLPLSPVSNKMVCRNCEKHFDKISVCPKCQNTNLKTTGLTTNKLEKIVKDSFPQAKTLRMEKDFELGISTDWDICISTNIILKKDFNNIGLVAIIDADQGINFPGFRTPEANFQTLYKLVSLAPNAIIQTHLVETNLIKSLASLNYEQFYQTELADREKFNYPPFTNLIRLTYKSLSEKECLTESQKVKNKLSQLNQDEANTQVLGPSPSHQALRRGYFTYQIIIKQKSRSKAIDQYLKELPRGWGVNVDPYDIV